KTATAPPCKQPPCQGVQEGIAALKTNNLRRKLPREERFRGRGGKLTRNVLPSAQEANAVLRPQHQVPELSPAPFLVQMGDDEVVHRQEGEGADLLQQERHVVGPVQ